MAAYNCLQAARALIQRGWCQRAYCRTASGEELLDPRDPEAVAWCVIGALYASSLIDADHDVAAEMLGVALSTNELSRWNDWPTRTQADVLGAFDRAMALSETPLGRVIIPEETRYVI